MNKEHAATIREIEKVMCNLMAPLGPIWSLWPARYCQDGSTPLMALNHASRSIGKKFGPPFGWILPYGEWKMMNLDERAQFVRNYLAIP